MYIFDGLLLLILSFSFTQGHGYIKASTFSPNVFPPYLFLILIYFVISFVRHNNKQYIKIIDTLKKIIFVLVFALTVGKSFYTAVNLRHLVPNYPVHDNPLQLEAAVNFLKHGKNPYTENYYNTPQQDWYAEKENPALHHLVTLPFYVLFSLFISYPAQLFLGYFDERIVHFISLLISLALIWRLVKNTYKKVIYLSLFAFNPLLTHFFIEGRNDIFVFCLVFLCLYFLYAQKILYSSFFLGLALVSKQSSWLLGPLFILYIFLSQPQGLAFIKKIKKTIFATYPLFLITLFFIVPFLISDFKSFIEDTIYYPGGNLTTSFPMTGMGLSYVLVKMHVVKNGMGYFPFMIVQAIFAIPWLVYAYLQIKIKKLVYLLTFSFTIFLFIFWYFSRFFIDNYLGFLSMLFIITGIFYELEVNDLNTNKNKLISKKTRVKSSH